MDLSICIPVYNQPLLSLVETLHRQAQKLHASWEIVVLDDGSEAETTAANSQLKNVSGVVYEELPQNVGRAAIRNRLAEKARGKKLLFLDDDSLPAEEDFLEKYLQQDFEGVVCGGRQYPEKLPGKAYSLHYTYGTQRESKPATERAKNPYLSFHSNNFMIPKESILQQPFDESLKKYGHEDTLFAFQLFKTQVPIRHIHNPVIHSQLETNEEFLKKSLLALENLKILGEREASDFVEFVRFLRSVRKFEKAGLTRMIKSLYRKRKQDWEIHLMESPKPGLRVFNLYKLGYFFNLSKGSRKDA